MARILFIDDRMDEIHCQWQLSGCENDHELLPLQPFESIEQARWMVEEFRPDVILVGYGLNKSDITGADVIRSLREEGYKGRMIANSGGGRKLFDRSGIVVDGSADRTPNGLKTTVDNLEGR